MQYMTHAKHGKMPVYSPTEIQINQKHGWVLEKAVLSLVDQYEAKFGKKPHHRMKNETIRQKLDE